ncbi:hydratase [Noviherbaspirillum cavernae]|uniref:Hydratase n=1 Tax=Noviherbaspirillum cavernae TaxID=2320862 RepID=A0A418WVT4_9BURK|nr:fumarylacetoacetate hydrolase family protein [Noviherbaspirillum cavernae]RJF96815.1 hydratase [Noviherbaspirillum cavernae]
MSQNRSSVTAAASILAARRTSNEQGPRLPESCRPLDTDTALAIQAAVTAQLGERIGGWKCGMPVQGATVLAPIHAGTIHTASPCAALARTGQVRIEPELAFILGHDLPPRDAPYSTAEVDAAITRTHLALELIDSRYSNPGEADFAENLADGLLNQGLFIGPQVDGEKARMTGAMPISVTLESGEATQLDGRHPNAEPRAPLYWLVEFLRSKGQGLRAGQAVITGSYAGSFDVPAEQEITIRYGELGVLKVRFAPAAPPAPPAPTAPT